MLYVYAFDELYSLFYKLKYLINSIDNGVLLFFMHLTVQITVNKYAASNCME